MIPYPPHRDTRPGGFSPAEYRAEERRTSGRTPLQRHDDWRAQVDHFRNVLLGAIAERSARDEWAEGPQARELAWVTYEREVMHKAVNAERQIHGLPPATLEDVQRAERQAYGHSDYVATFAIGCAELATAPAGEGQ